MEATAATTPSSARELAIHQLRSEHRNLARVLEALETLTAEIAEDKASADFVLLASMLYYIDIVPERFHHPKEDQYLFTALRLRDPGIAALLDRLAQQHQRSPDLVTELERALVHWQGGAPDGFDQFALALGNFSDFQWAHMRAEEHEVMPCAERLLTDADWQAMAQAFAANQDPLFGVERRREFEQLYRRIANLAPRKLRREVLQRDS